MERRGETDGLVKREQERWILPLMKQKETDEEVWSDGNHSLFHQPAALLSFMLVENRSVVPSSKTKLLKLVH